MSVKLTLFEHCEWPPGPGADQTGYVDTFLTEVPGDTSWPGEINPLTQADGIDSSCRRLQILYTGGHTGSSFSDTVVISSGTLAITQPNWQGLTIPGEQPGEAPNLTEWAQGMAYYLTPGEMAVLHADDESASSVDCLAAPPTTVAPPSTTPPTRAAPAKTSATHVPAPVVAECQTAGGDPRPGDDPPECLHVPYVGTDGSRYYIEVGMSAAGLIPPDLTGDFAANQTECISGQYPMANPGKNTPGEWEPAIGLCKPRV
jgi:hypothetical protein